MIGPHYWSTGITLRWDGEAWGLSLKFFDDGFCDVASTVGTLHVRYRIKPDDLASAIDVLIEDAKRLGIIFKRPTLYVAGDGEWKTETYHPQWKRILAEQEKRLGWEA